jgi:hypothetical protein
MELIFFLRSKSGKIRPGQSKSGEIKQRAGEIRSDLFRASGRPIGAIPGRGSRELPSVTASKVKERRPRSGEGDEASVGVLGVGDRVGVLGVGVLGGGGGRELPSVTRRKTGPGVGVGVRDQRRRSLATLTERAEEKDGNRGDRRRPEKGRRRQ